MKCLVETDAGDAGYCSSQYIPGTLTVKKEAKYYFIDWNVNNLDYQFELSLDGSQLTPVNSVAELLMEEHAPQN